MYTCDATKNQVFLKNLVSRVAVFLKSWTTALGHKFVPEQKCQSLALAGGGRRSVQRAGPPPHLRFRRAERFAEGKASLATPPAICYRNTHNNLCPKALQGFLISKI
jgi:hypothetical protein